MVEKLYLATVFSQGLFFFDFFHEIKIIIASLYAGLFYLPTKYTVFWVF